MSNTKQVYIQVNAENIASNGTASYSGGNPIVRFSLGEREMHLIPSSIRLSGQIACFYNSAQAGSLSASNLNISNKLGAMGVVEQIQIASQRTKQTIEHITHVDRLYSSLETIRSSEQDYCSPFNNERLVVPNKFLQEKVVSNPTTKNTPSTFCIPLICGFTAGSDLCPLSAVNGVGGIEITLSLASNSSFFYNSSLTPSTDMDSAFYELSNLQIFAEGIISSDGSPLPVINELDYISINSYYETINSTNATINMPLAKSRVLGVFANFMPSSYINNRDFDGTQCRPPLNSDGTVAKISQLTFTKGGVRLPLQYNISTIHRDQNTDSCDAQILYNYINGITSFVNLNRTNINNLNTNCVNGATDKLVRELGNLYGIGVSFTNISRDGIDFMNESFGVQIDLDLTSDNPNSVFLFAVNRQTITFNSQNGIMVSN